MGAFVERLREDLFINRLKPLLAFENRLLEGDLRRGVGAEGLAFLNADRFERIDHGFVASEPGLDLDDAIQRLKEAQVVWNGGVEDDAKRVDELRVRRMGGLRERVDPSPFAIGHCVGDICIIPALEVGTKNRKALVSRGWHGNVAVRNLVLIAGRKDEVLSAFTLVDAGGTHVFDGCLPAVVHGTRDRAVSAGGISSTTGPTSLVLKNGIK